MNPARRDWRTTVSAFWHPRVITMLFLGLSAGLPLLLIFSSLSLWLREAGVERATVTFFSWAALGYSFKFVWAPLVDRLPIPFLSRLLGRRRGWMLLAQIAVALAILWMASTDPNQGDAQLTTMAFAAVLLGFSSATQDIVIDAYRIESAEEDLQALMSSTYIAGYRIGMLLAGAGALFLASYFGSELGSYSYDAWRLTYTVMAAGMGIGMITTLIIPEPISQAAAVDEGARDYVGLLLLFLCAVAVFVFTFANLSSSAATVNAVVRDITANAVLGAVLAEAYRFIFALLAAVLVAAVLVRLGMVKKAMVMNTYVAPIAEFFQRYGMKLALLLLALIGLYRISDIVLGVIANVFYQDLQFTKTEIATVVKSFGLGMTILGGFLGGLLSMRYGVMRILLLGAVLTVVTNLFFIGLAVTGKNTLMLYFVISADNLTAGIASAAFIAFLSSLTNVRFTAVQYAVFSSLMTLIPKVLGGYSGTLVDSVGYINFFIVAAVLGLPVLLLVWLAGRHLELDEPVMADPK